jgi:hypothetical protein
LSQERSRNQPNDRFEQFSRDLIRWIVGPGLLSVHMCAFFVTMVALLLWNYSREPDDLWVAEPLRRWGLVVVFHAVAVAVGAAAWRLMRMGQPAAPGPLETRPVELWQPKEHRAQPADTYLAERAEHASASARAEEWARRWLRESRKVVRDATGTHTEPTNHIPPPPRDLGQMTAPPPEPPRGKAFGKRALGALSAARERVKPHTNGVEHPNGTDPIRTWPSSSEPPVPTEEIEHQLEWTSGTWAFTPTFDQPPPAPPMDDEAVSAPEETRWAWMDSTSAPIDPEPSSSEASDPEEQRPDETTPA